MANRTFKVYGQAYAASGDVNVTMTVGGTQVFSGAVNDSTTVREGQPSIENHLWTYELDENAVGNLDVSITVTGGELCIGATKYNSIHTKIISDDWFADPANSIEIAEKQAYVAGQLGQALLDAEQAGLYDKLMAGTATAEADGADIYAANLNGPKTYTDFVIQEDLRLSAKINGTDMESWDNSEVNIRNWPILQDGDVWTYTWVFEPETYWVPVG